MEENELITALNNLHLRIEEHSKRITESLVRAEAQIAALILVLDLTDDQKLDFYNLSKEIYEKNIKKFNPENPSDSEEG
jgi:hypothetical protein